MIWVMCRFSWKLYLKLFSPSSTSGLTPLLAVLFIAYHFSLAQTYSAPHLPTFDPLSRPFEPVLPVLTSHSPSTFSFCSFYSPFLILLFLSILVLLHIILLVQLWLILILILICLRSIPPPSSHTSPPVPFTFCSFSPSNSSSHYWCFTSSYYLCLVYWSKWNSKPNVDRVYNISENIVHLIGCKSLSNWCCPTECHTIHIAQTEMESTHVAGQDSSELDWTGRDRTGGNWTRLWEVRNKSQSKPN